MTFKWQIELYLDRPDLVVKNFANIHATSSPDKIVPMFQNWLLCGLIESVLIQPETSVWSNVVRYEDSHWQIAIVVDEDILWDPTNWIILDIPQNALGWENLISSFLQQIFFLFSIYSDK